MFRINRRHILTQLIMPLLSVIGLVFAVLYTTSIAPTKAMPPAQLAIPAGSPYMETVSGSGTVEANTRNINIGVFRSGIVEKINVKEGDVVEAGALLFKLDDRQAQAELAQTSAAVAEAKAALSDARDQLTRAEGLKSGLAISKQLFESRKFSVAKAQAALEAAWANEEAAFVRLEQHSITAPTKARVLKININAGEFVTAGTATPPMIIGNDNPLHVRVQIDENDLPRLRANDAEASAFIRSNALSRFSLKFVRIDPYVLPKRSLTGDNAERVDTRVLELVYELQNPENIPVFIGQQMDVFIDAAKKADASATK